MSALDIRALRLYEKRLASHIEAAYYRVRYPISRRVRKQRGCKPIDILKYLEFLEEIPQPYITLDLPIDG